jgi:hypothetical protein
MELATPTKFVQYCSTCMYTVPGEHVLLPKLVLIDSNGEDLIIVTNLHILEDCVTLLYTIHEYKKQLAAFLHLQYIRA